MRALCPATGMCSIVTPGSRCRLYNSSWLTTRALLYDPPQIWAGGVKVGNVPSDQRGNHRDKMGWQSLGSKVRKRLW